MYGKNMRILISMTNIVVHRNDNTPFPLSSFFFSLSLPILKMLPSSLLHFTNKPKGDKSIGYLAHIDTIEDSLRALSLLLPGTHI